MLSFFYREISAYTGWQNAAVTWIDLWLCFASPLGLTSRILLKFKNSFGEERRIKGNKITVEAAYCDHWYCYQKVKITDNKIDHFPKYLLLLLFGSCNHDHNNIDAHCFTRNWASFNFKINSCSCFCFIQLAI